MLTMILSSSVPADTAAPRLRDMNIGSPANWSGLSITLVSTTPDSLCVVVDVAP